MTAIDVSEKKLPIHLMKGGGDPFSSRDQSPYSYKERNHSALIQQEIQCDPFILTMKHDRIVVNTENTVKR